MHSPLVPSGGKLPPQWRVYAYGGLVLAALFLLYRLRSILPPFLAGVIVAFILDPFLDRLQRRGWSRTKAVGFVYAVSLTTLILLALLVIPPIVGYVGSWVERIQGIATDLAQVLDVESLEEFEARLEARFPALADHIDVDWVALAPDIQRAREGLLRTVESKSPQWAQQAAGILYRVIAGSASTLMSIIFVPLTAFYFSIEIDPLRARVMNWVPEDYRESVLRVGADVNEMLSSFFRGQLALMGMVGTSALVTMLVIGRVWHIELGAVLFLSLWYGLTYCIPIVGAVSSLALAAGTCFVLSGYNWVCAAVALGVFWAINLVFDNVVTPRVVGHKVGLHPLVVLFGVFAGYHVLGLLGMIVAVPLAALVKIVIDEFLPEVFARLPGQGDPAMEDGASVPAASDDGREPPPPAPTEED